MVMRNIRPDQVRGAISNAFEEAEFFDGMSTKDSTYYAHLINELPDSTLISLARHIRSIKFVDSTH